MLFLLKKWCNPWNYKVCNKKYSGRFDTTAAGKEDLNMVYVNMEMPEEMEPFAMPPGKEGQLKRNAMILKW